MEKYLGGIYDCAVIGGGHAGIEASLACARLGLKTVMFTINLDAVGNMPCNPSIGGTAKGHLVREIDALGGQMAKAADRVFLQSRMLNRGKGPAVHSLRVQADRARYRVLMKKTLEEQENLDIKQDEIVRIGTENGKVSEVETRLGAVYKVGAAIVATGTFLGGRIFIGDINYDGGPDGMHAATELQKSLRDLGLSLRRFKTGTPARIHKKSIDFERLEVQHGDEPVEPMSFENEDVGGNTADCWIAYTNEKTHDIIRKISNGPRCIRATLSASVRVTVRRSKQRSSVLRTKPAISFLLSRWGRTPTKCISEECLHLFPRMFRQR